LLINFFTLIGPFFGSFERKVNFKSKWKYAVPATLLIGIPFLLWDIVFTEYGVWGFNDAYHIGVTIAGLPIEECLFFFSIPFACLLIYETVKTLRPSKIASPFALMLGAFLGIGFIINAILCFNQAYTFATFFSTGVVLLIHAFILKKKYFANFLITYLIHLIPFFIVNGVLTYLPVVWYNHAENMGIRIGSIPLDDIVYSMLLLLGNITVYEYLGDFFAKENQ
jgi:lycopene cyclase domain-containing protein